ncbi:MAG: TIGR03862 family flavoprotein [Cohaesibacter sp.]|nr:TIGR03862 family flavoprotein [Cohaesibacter sp.]
MTDSSVQSIAIIGAGAAGLMAADHLSELAHDQEQNWQITLYDAMPSPARKMLMAGKSGLNLTHAQPIDDFVAAYGPYADWIGPMIREFGPREVRSWSYAMGQSTFEGSSGRVFPDSMKASPLLRSHFKHLEARGVNMMTRHRWIGWTDDKGLLFETPDGPKTIKADAVLLALGGPSWPRLGTDGSFLSVLAEKGIASTPYRPANCGFEVDWSEDFVTQWAGEPVKSVRLHFGDDSIEGDFVITRYGLEGSAVYGLCAPLRDALETGQDVDLLVDLRSHHDLAEVERRLSQPRGKQSFANHIRKRIHLKGVQAALLKECTERSVMNDMGQLARAVKALPIRLTRPRPLDEAISTAGGVCLSELDDGLMVKREPGLFIAGEMLDWEAPTGGYLLTGCFSQGHRAALGIGRYLNQL